MALAAIVAPMLAVALVLSINEGIRNGDWGGVGFLAATGLILAVVAVAAIVAG